MTAGSFEVLGLRSSQDHPLVAAFRPVIDRLLELLCETLAVSEGMPDADDVLGRMATYRTALAEATSGDQVTAIGESILDLCREVLEKSRNERLTTRAELPSLIALVRDAVTTIAGEGHAFCASVTDSARRFEALREIPDIHQIKLRLTSEVNQLKQLAVKRELQWKSKVSTFENRIVMLEEQLVETKAQASHDPLTGLANRRRFQAAFKDMHSRRRQIVVALFDLDNFKAVNDTLGHASGDKVLVKVADILKASVRIEDVVARLGGDEFALMMVDVSLPLAEKRLRAVVASMAAMPVGADAHTLQVSASCGAAECSAGDTLDSLLHRADQALYDAKRSGKNRVASRSSPFIRDLRGG